MQINFLFPISPNDASYLFNLQGLFIENSKPRMLQKDIEKQQAELGLFE